jgi:hypothetical protein
MLAYIESELNAPDRAVEGLRPEFGDDGSGVRSSSSPPDDDVTAYQPDSYVRTYARVYQAWQNKTAW